MAEMMADLKVKSLFLLTLLVTPNSILKVKLEIQYAAKRDALSNEVADLKQQLEARNTEVRKLNASIDSLKSVNEELKVSLIFCPPTAPTQLFK